MYLYIVVVEMSVENVFFYIGCINIIFIFKGKKVIVLIMFFVIIYIVKGMYFFLF